VLQTATMDQSSGALHASPGYFVGWQHVGARGRQGHGGAPSVRKVLMIHVAGTRCVTWSIDRIVQRQTCITWGVEFIRAIFFIFFFYV